MNKNLTNYRVVRPLEIYKKLNIELHKVPVQFQNDYLQVEYWLLRHPERGYCPPSEKWKRFIEAARHLYLANDLPRLLQLYNEVPQIRGVAMFKNELEQKGRPRCCDCRFWSGLFANRPGDVMCAVNPLIQPDRDELRKVDNRRAYARHDCPDFESTVTPALGGYSPTSNRCHTFEFTD